MSYTGLMSLTAAELLEGYRTGMIDPVAAVDECLDGLEGTGRATGVVLAVGERDSVRASAAVARDRWRTGTARPLEGIPFGIKDIIATADLPTTGGSSVMGDLIARVDAPCVARLRDDGAIAVAKLATSEFAAGQPDNATFGRVANPWDGQRWTGGSSTGSGAALGHRLLPLTIGTDTGGSVRLPSAWCGTTGLKATYGRVPRTGVLPLSWTLDHVGPMARTARDCGLMLASMAGYDIGDPNSAREPIDQELRVVPGSGASTSLVGKRVGVVEGWFTELCDRDVYASWCSAIDVLADAGATIVEVELPSAHLAFLAGWELLFAEAASLHEAHIDRLHELDPGFVQRMLQGRFLLAVDYLRAMRLRTLVLDEALQALDGVDALCTVGVPGTAPRFDDLRVDVDDTAHPMQKVHSRSTMFGNFTGLPALMFPSGFDRKGMPTAIQLIGRPFDEREIITMAAAFQERTSFHEMTPPPITPTKEMAQHAP